MKIIDKDKKQFCISIDTFCVDIQFFINYSGPDILNYCKKKNKPLFELIKDLDFDSYNDLAVEAMMYPLKRGYMVMLKFYKDSFRMNLSNAMHEISHLVSWILLDRRIKLSKNTDEVYAYLTEEIVRKFLLKL